MPINRTTNNNLLTPGFWVDPHTLIRGVGGQIYWTDVPAGYINSSTGKKEIPAGKIMVELTTGLGIGKLVPNDATSAAAATKAVLLHTSAQEDEKQAAESGYGTLVGGNIYENLLPDAAGGPPRVISGALKTLLNAGGQWIFSVRQETR
jgi:hypothetical protein